MKTLSIIILGIIIFTLSSCSCEREFPDAEYYKNIDLKIVSINNDESLTQDKYHKPQMCNIILFETTSDTNKFYMEYNTCEEYKNGPIHIDVPWIYNHKPGDIVHFDYLRKSRFFTIKR